MIARVTISQEEDYESTREESDGSSFSIVSAQERMAISRQPLCSSKVIAAIAATRLGRWYSGLDLAPHCTAPGSDPLMSRWAFRLRGPRLSSHSSPRKARLEGPTPRDRPSLGWSSVATVAAESIGHRKSGSRCARELAGPSLPRPVYG
jgi:hypothetical protein